MASKLHRIGLFAARRHWVVLGAWLVAVVLIGGVVSAVGADTSNNLELPGTDSQAATDLLADKFPPQQNGTNPLVFSAESGEVTSGENKRAIQAAHANVKELSSVDTATSPFARKGQAQVSDDKRTAFIPVLLSTPNQDLGEEQAQRVLDAGRPAVEAGMKVAVGGQVGSVLSKPETESSEVVGLAAAMIILAFTFGTLVAMGLPIVSAVVGLIIGLSLIGLLGHLVQVPEIGPTLAIMIGLGVGIDYALFLVTRYRTERAAGADVDKAVATAVSTSGTAIVFAGTTVVIALVTLLIAGIPLVTSLGYASAFAVATAVLAAITLLPALLAALGPRIDRLTLPSFLHRGPREPGRGPAATWARLVTSHPWRAIGIGGLVLGLLMVPFFSLELGQEDIGATPRSTTERQAYDLMADGFGVGYNGPLLIAVELGTPAKPSEGYRSDKQRAEKLQAKLESEQASGEAEAASLQTQADELQGEQATLEGEQAALEGEASALGVERAGLEQRRDELAQRRSLERQLSRLIAQARPLARRTAELAARQAELEGRIGAVRALEERTREELERASGARRERLRRRLDRLQARESALSAELANVTAERRDVEQQASRLAAEAAAIRDEAETLGGEAESLALDAAGLAQQAFSLEQSKDALEQQAAEAQIEAANLQAEQAQLEVTQQKAKQQKREAEGLKQTLTKELTRAGGDPRGTDHRLVKLQKALSKTVGVKVVSPPRINGSGDAAILSVIATTAPADTATADLVGTVRDYVIPQSTAGEDVTAHVGGQTASYVDLATGISDKLGLVIAAVIALGFAVLMMAFRSMLVPAQAAIANVLAVMAAFGVVTLCFQEGWGLSLIGVETSSGTVPIASYVPLIMFAVLFGLSMDYQVFLMSQIEQHRATTRSNEEAIAAGLAAGARVITAAALIMICVFASFILNGDPTVKQFGVGLAVGVALAAGAVLTLAPAILVLAGRGSWWVPRWADRALPHIDIEGAHQNPAKGRP